MAPSVPEKISEPTVYEYTVHVGDEIVLDTEYMGIKTWDTFNLINGHIVLPVDRNDVRFYSLDEPAIWVLPSRA